MTDEQEGARPSNRPTTITRSGAVALLAVQGIWLLLGSGYLLRVSLAGPPGGSVSPVAVLLTAVGLASLSSALYLGRGRRQSGARIVGAGATGVVGLMAIGSLISAVSWNGLRVLTTPLAGPLLLVAGYALVTLAVLVRLSPAGGASPR